MDNFRSRSPAEENFGWFKRALGRLTVDPKGSVSNGSTDAVPSTANENEDPKGPLGLNLLHSVPEPLVDFIFIHGLGGGSRKTWSKTPDPYHYWPKEWISRDPEFSCARVHSFGYNTDWAERRSSFLNIHDFSLALLGEIQCNPDIRRSNTKIVLVAHSMGGIVSKKAYILAREDPAMKEIASRIHTLYFLATPHRGADLAKTLHNILKASFAQKHFVVELQRNSDSIQAINDSFSYFADDLQLWSFYETLPINLHLINVTIVDKASATLGLSKERCSLLNADHRGVCKFDSPTDSNYKILRNAFITTVDSILTEGMSPRCSLALWPFIYLTLVSQKVSDTTKTEYSNLISLTGVSEAPLDDHLALEEVRAPGSCHWLNSKGGYTTWKSARSFNTPIFWLTGDAGCGKSVLSSYVINDLEKSDVKCSYFYFKQSDANKSTITSCLQSLAFQMGQKDEKILRRISKVSGCSETWEQLDERTLWRKVFLGCIFKESNSEPHYWVIDALDECRRLSVLVSLLAKAPPYLRIFLTSRNTPQVHQSLTSHSPSVEHYSVQEQDTLADLRIYVDSRMHFFPADDDESWGYLRAKMLARASGSFLWTSLVVRELEGVYSKEAAEEVLNKVPPGMNELYARMLERIPPTGFKLAQSAFTWTLLAMRPLSLEELKSAIKLETGETVHNLANVITSICGQLIRVNQNGQVQWIHQTAKVFFVHQEVVPSLVINKPKSHSRIAELCLTSLNTNFGIRFRRKARAPGASAASNIADYAALYFSDHLQNCASETSKIWNILAEFLETNVLAWIEYLAQTGRLRYLTRTAKNLKSYLMRRLEHIKPSSNEKEGLESWVHDLIRLNAKFRTALVVCPSSIHTAIPALCPSESTISKTYSSSSRGIIVKGLTERIWDECLVRIEYPNETTSAVAHGHGYFAVAVRDGTIFLYLRDSTELNTTLSHGEQVDILHFSSDDLYLASSGSLKVRVWDIQTQTQTWSFDVQHQPLTLAFSDDSTFLIAATRGNYTISWDLQDYQTVEEIWSWTSRFQAATGQENPLLWTVPIRAALSEDCLTLAVSCRGKHIYLFDMRTELLIGPCSRYPGKKIVREYIVDALAFNPSPEINVLVASYGEGGLALFDRRTTELRYKTHDVFAHTLACSPDGRMLITGSARGIIKIFEFSGVKGTNLTLIYRVNAFEDGIHGVAFSNDSMRFMDIGRYQCRIWEPSVLISNDYDKGSQSKPSQAVTLNPKSVVMFGEPLEPEITAICPHPSGKYLFCGNRDGSVTYFDVQNAAQRDVLCQHANPRITCIAYCQKGELLVTADGGSQILVTTLQCTSTSCEPQSTIMEVHSEEVVRGLLVNNSGTRILVQTKNSAQVWTMLGTKTNTEVMLDESKDYYYTFVNHPLDSGTFLVLGPNHTAVHLWNDVSDMIDVNGNGSQDITVVGKDEPILDLEHLVKILSAEPKSSHKLIAALRKLHNPRAKSKVSELMIWDASKISLDREWPEKISLPEFEHISVNIRQLICVTGSVVLFLDSDLWVCSVDMTRWIVERQGARRHFFLLPEWRENDEDVLIEYLSTRREFLVVKKNDVLVVRRGLDIEMPLEYA